jgi:hypothetical protein
MREHGAELSLGGDAMPRCEVVGAGEERFFGCVAANRREQPELLERPL